MVGIFMENLGKYTSPIDSIGFIHTNGNGRASKTPRNLHPKLVTGGLGKCPWTSLIHSMALEITGSTKKSTDFQGFLKSHAMIDFPYLIKKKETSKDLDPL